MCVIYAPLGQGYQLKGEKPRPKPSISQPCPWSVLFEQRVFRVMYKHKKYLFYKCYEYALGKIYYKNIVCFLFFELFYIFILKGPWEMYSHCNT